MNKTSGIFTKLLLIIAISACGFEPVYGVNSPNRTSLSSISFADPVSNSDFVFLGFAEQTIPKTSDPVLELIIAPVFQMDFRFRIIILFADP